jgi:hypothetical protein
MCWWLRLVILAIQEAEIQRIKLEASPRKYFERLYLEKTPSQRRAGGVA